MTHYDGQNSAVARAARIRRSHDMEATMLGIMHRRAESDESDEPGMLSRMVARLRRRTRGVTQLIEPELSAPETLRTPPVDPGRPISRSA